MSATVEQEFVAALKPDPEQPRKTFDPEHLRRLGQSLRKRQWYPLLIQPTRVIVDGECRWRAAQLAGIEKLDVIVVGPDMGHLEALDAQLITALQRAPLSPFEQAGGFRNWLAKNPGKTAKELSARIDRDQSLITKYVSVFDCIQPVQDAAASSKIGPSQWYPISLVPADQQLELLEMHLTGVPRDQLAAACRKKRTKASAERQQKQSRVVCPLTTGAKLVVSGPAMALSDLIDNLQAALELVRKAHRDQLDVRTAERVWRDRAKAGGA
jgi:ParB family chromosome partitioning protein